MRIFVNYRRDDNPAATGRIDDHLRNAFGRDNVYRDIDDIPLGVDFTKHIRKAVGECDIFIAVIGKNWGTQRLLDKNDFVRIEIEAALNRDIPVIPVLVDGSTFPKPEELPETLQPLLKRNAILIDSGSTFSAQMRHLVEGVRKLRKIWTEKIPEKKQPDVIISEPGGVELVRIPGGVFMMGSPEEEEGRYDSEGPVHEVRVSDFYLARYPVTNEEYGRFLNADKDARKPEYWGDRQFNQPRQPVVGVSWDDAKKYCEWAGLRLPSEAEWEYACRAGTTTGFYSGDSDSDLDWVGWYRENSGAGTHAVGEKEPNQFGLYDMHGNVEEWVEDDWHGSYSGAPTDGNAWVDVPRAGYRVFRGGSWDDFAGDCRSAYRRWRPGGRLDNLGFRPARSNP